ncbi:MAG TPA: hypothetical protein VE325_08285 [Burkholderiales bacterium]|nr:hypothetical protein [Burkholderiales bacterium]
MSRVIALERYIGSSVHDADDQPIGRLHEVRVRRERNELVVVGYLVGRAGFLERFSLGELAREVGFLIGFRRPGGYFVPWEAMEFTDAGPRCTRRASELERSSAAPRAAR